MATLRFNALKSVLQRERININEDQRRSVLFNSNVFDETKMKQYLTAGAYEAVSNAMIKGTQIDRPIADQILFHLCFIKDM